jgi:hypothetical protein
MRKIRAFRSKAGVAPRRSHHGPGSGSTRRDWTMTFSDEYHELKKRFSALAETDGNVYVPNVELGHVDLAITSRYLRAIDNNEIIQAVHQRPEPMIPAARRLLPPR